MIIRYFILTILLTLSIHIQPIHSQQQPMHKLPDGAITRLGKGGINTIQFTHDGQRLAVGSDIGIWLYDVTTGKEIPLPNKTIGQVNTIAISPDNTKLACGGYFNPIIQLWDLETGLELSQLSVPVSYRIRNNGIQEIRSVVELTFTKNGSNLIGVSHTGIFFHWNLITEELVSKKLEYDLSPIKSSTISDDGSIFLTGIANGEITIWDPHTGNIKEVLPGHKPKIKLGKKRTGIRSLAFSPNGNMVASGSEDSTVQLWNTKKRTEQAYLKGHKGWITALAFSNDGTLIASGDTNGIIYVWDTNKKRRIASIEAHKNTINALAFSPDGKTLASGSADGKILFWNQNNWEQHTTFIDGHTEWVKSVAFSSDNNTISTAAYNNTVQKYDTYTGKKLSDFSSFQQNLTKSVVLSPDASLLACYPVKGFIAFNAKQNWHNEINIHSHENIRICDLKTGNELPPKIHSSGTMTFTPDSKLIALNSFVFSKKRSLDNPFRTYTSLAYNGIYIWDVRSGETKAYFKPKGSITRPPLTFSPNGTKLVTQDARPFHTQLWDVEHQQNHITLKQDADAVAFSPDGSLLATISSFDIHIWDAHTEKRIRELIIQEEDAVNGMTMVFSPESSILLVSKYSHVLPYCLDTIELFDIKTSKKLHSLSGHTETIETLVFSHDGKVLASGSRDGTVILWDWYKILNKINNAN